MADNTVLNLGTGGDTIATDDIGGVKYQRTKVVWGSDGTATDTDANNPLPISVNAANFIFSVNNSSSTQLGAGATFTGTIETALNQPAISLLMTSDQPMQVVVKQYIDVSGTYAVPPVVFNIAKNQQFSRSFVLNGNYVRVTAQNIGTDTTTTFNLNTAYGSIDSADGQGNVPVILNGSGDYSGVSLLEECISGNLALTTQTINAERRDINGAQVVSDAPKTVEIVASTVGQQFLIDTQGYQSLCLTMGTMAASIAGNNDARGTFGAISAFPVVLGAPVTTAAASTNYVIPCLTRYIKLTVTTLGWATYTLRSVPVPVPYLANQPINLAQYLGVAASSTNPVHVTPLALAATNNQSLNTFNLVTALAPAGSVIKASAGRLTSLNIMNGGTVAGFLHLCNSATCTPGTTATTFIYAVPGAVANYSISLPDGGLYLSAGISYYFSAGAASTDNTSFGSAPALALNASYI